MNLHSKFGHDGSIAREDRYGAFRAIHAKAIQLFEPVFGPETPCISEASIGR